MRSRRVETKDIIMGINNSTGQYNIDSDGLVQVDWTDKKVPLTNNEFIMSLDPKSVSWLSTNTGPKRP